MHGFRSNTVVLLALALAIPLESQDDPYSARRLHYKRFTRDDDQRIKDEAWGRLEWFRERMGGDLSAEFSDRLIREAERERARHPGRFPRPGAPEPYAQASGNSWINLGPTKADFTQNGVTLNKVDSGRLRIILPDIADATGNTVYVLASGGGLWKTTNFLANLPTWVPLTDFVGSNISGSASFGRTSSTIYLAAGDPFDNGVGGFAIKSTDGGATWSAHATLGTATKVLDLKVDTSQVQDIVLAGTNAGLYRSTDGGSTFSAISTLTGYVWSLAKTSAGWLASRVASNGIGTILLSTDQGASWSAVNSPTYTGAGRTTLAVGTPGDAVVYAYAATQGTAPYSESSQKDLFRSTDGGLNWIALGLGTKTAVNVGSNADQPNMDLMHDQAWYNQMILVDPSDGTRNTVYLGGDLSAAKTVDGGSTWNIISNWLPYTFSGTANLPYVHADLHCAAFSLLGGVPRLYIGTDGGIFTSVNAGASWDDTKNTGIVSHLAYTLISNPANAGSVLTGFQDNGTRIRSGTTSTFNQVRGGDGFGVGWSQATNGASLSSYVYNSIKRSTTNPVTSQSNWTTFTTGLGSTDSTDGGASYYFKTPIVTPSATADSSGQVFFTYSNGKTGPNSKRIFQSNASGWTAIGTAGIAGLSANSYVRSVSHGLGVSPIDLQHIAAAGASGYVLLTSDGGSLWSEVFVGALDTGGNQAPGSQINGWHGYNANLAWANNTLLYLCSESPNAGAVRVAKSSNSGTTWVAAATGLPDVPVTKLAVDPGDASGNTVYAATWLGVYSTTNGGSSWSLHGSGLPQGRVTDIWVAPDSSVVRVSTWGRGIWEISGSGARSADLNGDGVTDLQDLLFFAKCYGTATASCDLNSDGTVNDADLALLLAVL